MTYIHSHEQVARIGGLAAVALLCVTIAGCTAEPTPTPSSTATTHWKDGVEPAPNDLENTPYVKYLRDIAWAEAIAWNTGDFSIPEYNDHGWDNEATEAELRYEHQGDEAYVYLAPQPFVPLKIEQAVEADPAHGNPAFYTLLVCVAPEITFKRMVSSAASSALGTKPHVVDHLMSVRRNGSVTDLTSGSEISCDDVDVPIALFDEPPTLPGLPVTEPKRTAPPATK